MFDTYHTVEELPYDVLSIGGRGHIIYPDFAAAEKAYAKFHAAKTDGVEYMILMRTNGYVIAIIDHVEEACMYL